MLSHRYAPLSSSLVANASPYDIAIVVCPQLDACVALKRTIETTCLRGEPVSMHLNKYLYPGHTSFLLSAADVCALHPAPGVFPRSSLIIPVYLFDPTRSCNTVDDPGLLINGELSISLSQATSLVLSWGVESHTFSSISRTCQVEFSTALVSPLPKVEYLSSTFTTRRPGDFLPFDLASIPVAVGKLAACVHIPHSPLSTTLHIDLALDDLWDDAQHAFTCFSAFCLDPDPKAVIMGDAGHPFSSSKDGGQACDVMGTKIIAETEHSRSFSLRLAPCSRPIEVVLEYTPTDVILVIDPRDSSGQVHRTVIWNGPSSRLVSARGTLGSDGLLPSPAFSMSGLLYTEDEVMPFSLPRGFQRDLEDRLGSSSLSAIFRAGVAGTSFSSFSYALEQGRRCVQGGECPNPLYSKILAYFILAFLIWSGTIIFLGLGLWLRLRNKSRLRSQHGSRLLRRPRRLSRKQRKLIADATVSAFERLCNERLTLAHELMMTRGTFSDLHLQPGGLETVIE
ncbi:hypothetical protein GMRT_12389 [Giardia muris]|uniref:Uncharacterized protein n=1 Tax=Giardia muris TaxID=5742 RepID=A0A4Z1SNB8_GIAMU|nr:hypothetical protein GMRT_12389 [Giardia muris]|eukprot:TNJ27254.1 hypothetical protein GMRT_12389 [Giardia muris]